MGKAWLDQVRARRGLRIKRRPWPTPKLCVRRDLVNREIREAFDGVVYRVLHGLGPAGAHDVAVAVGRDGAAWPRSRMGAQAVVALALRRLRGAQMAACERGLWRAL